MYNTFNRKRERNDQAQQQSEQDFRSYDRWQVYWRDRPKGERSLWVGERYHEGGW